ncbi:hypothetical protein GCK32_013833 [Trichostrongylus colubriformis]|uniref:Uncharacterized protein n=1 Tax=Trichostrongylus colubriformis TaxID=6319 RepID=A0AAN8J0S7_TRICO
MFLIFTVLSVIIADVNGEYPASQKGNNINSTALVLRHPECNPSYIPDVLRSTITIPICAPDVESTFKLFNEKWIENPIWDDGIASEAYKEAVKRRRTDADFKLRDEWLWSKAKSNQTTLIQKLKRRLRIGPILQKDFFSTLHDWLSGELDKPVAIPKNIYYGCNGFFATGGPVDAMTTEQISLTNVTILLDEDGRASKWYLSIVAPE